MVFLATLSCCGGNSETSPSRTDLSSSAENILADQPNNEADIRFEEEFIGPSRIVEASLQRLLSEECVQRTSKMLADTSVHYVLLSPYDLGIQNITISGGEKTIALEVDESMTVDRFRDSDNLLQEDNKYFYLFNLHKGDERLVVEIMYPYAGSLYKLLAQRKGERWLIKDVICGSF